jgi:hypothetical protein
MQGIVTVAFVEKLANECQRLLGAGLSFDEACAEISAKLCSNRHLVVTVLEEQGLAV